MKYLSLFFFFILSLAVHANENQVLVQTEEGSEAARCEAKLMAIHKKSLTEKLQLVVWDAQHIEAAIANMKSAGEITDQMAENRIRAQLTLGAMFSAEGLLHEAVYQIFKKRYGSNAEIKDALRGFKNISTMNQKNILLSDVIEQVLQFIPDVDVKNVNQIKEIARFVNMNEDQLESFRNKWMVYDQNDSFVEILQGGILALLTTSTDKFVEDVVSRGSLKYGFLRKIWGIKAPEKPTAALVDLNPRLVQIENRSYYDDSTLLNYLLKSSSAARRFFIMDRIAYLTIEQLSTIISQERELWLKPSLVQVLRNEYQWRLVLKEKFKTLEDLRRDVHELEVTIARHENRLPYSSQQFQKALFGLGSEENSLEIVRDNAIQILDQYVTTCDSVQYVHVISAILSTATPRLITGDSKYALAVIEAAIRNANSIGMIDTHAAKVKSLLTSLGTRLRGRSVGVASEMLEKLDVETPKYATLTLPQLKVELERVALLLSAASDDLEAAFKKGP